MINKGFTGSAKMDAAPTILPHEPGLPAVERGWLRLFFIYDVADTIDLAKLATIAGEGLARAPLSLRAEASPGYIEFNTPPLVATLPAAPVDGRSLEVRVKIYDYGVVSVRLSAAFEGTLEEFNRLGRQVRRSEAVAAEARATLDRALAEIGTALDDPHAPLFEDYVIFEVERFERPVSGAFLLQDGAPTLAALLAGEKTKLAGQEQEELLRANFSYYDDDVTIVQWDTAFVYDDRESAAAIEDILEFANTQLAEARTYDARLDAELDRIYQLEPARAQSRLGRRADSRAAELRYLLIDIHELNDRSANALKIIGDAYYARLYRGAAQRLGLSEWQRQIDSKVQTVGEFYRFFTDQAQYAHSNFLEIVIIALIAVEILIGLLTLHH